MLVAAEAEQKVPVGMVQVGKAAEAGDIQIQTVYKLLLVLQILEVAVAVVPLRPELVQLEPVVLA